MSIAALLQAAEYLDRRERASSLSEAEHGYATSLPPSFDLDSPAVVNLVNGIAFPDNAFLEPLRHRSGSGSSTGSSSNSVNISKNRMRNGSGGAAGGRNKSNHQGNRSTHNELEKNRRAHLRNCLEKLKDIVPVGADSSRHTTLGLLNKAKHFIRTLEDKDRKVAVHKETLLREQRYLRRRLELLSNQMDAIHKRRSVSECSATSNGSSNHSSESDEHEVDVIGINFGGNANVGSSDDDRSSVRSSGSEGASSVGIASWTRQLTIGGMMVAQHAATSIEVQTA